MKTPPPSPRNVSVRAVLIALILTIPNSYWLMINWGPSGYQSGQSFPTVVSLYFNVIFITLLLLGWNHLARYVAPQKRLSDAELMVIYILLSLASSLAGHDMLQIFWPLMTQSIWYAQPENEWAKLFHHHIPNWLTIKDRAALAPFYHGESSLYIWNHLRLWLKPVLWWSALIIALTWMMLCFTVLIRRQWVYHERLTYPIIQIPLQITERSGGVLFKNRLFWIGFSIAGIINLINGIHFLVPAVPSVGGIGHDPFNMGFDLGKFFTEKPLSAIGYTPVAFYPFAVGLSFFIPLSLSFSIWFFYLFHKVVQVWQTTMGLENLVSAFGPQAQLFGAWFGIAIAALWTTRKFLTHQIRNALRSRDAGDEEARMVKWALIGLIACGAFVLLFCLSAGVSPVYVFAYFTLFFVVAIAISRVRAELGPPTHDALWNPGSALVIFFGTRSLGPKALTLFTMFRGFNRSYRSHPMPVMLEGFKAAELRRMSPRAIILPILLVTVVGTISSAWAFYSQAYRYGADVYGEHWGIGAFSQLRAWLVTPQRSSPVEITIAILSLSFTGLLAVMHRRFLWWPFHPAGYAIGIGYPTMHWYWFSILMSWSVKSILFRVGGIRTYRKGVPFFTGLVVGEFVGGALWALIGISLEKPMYRFMF